MSTAVLLVAAAAESKKLDELKSELTQHCGSKMSSMPGSCCC